MFQSDELNVVLNILYVFESYDRVHDLFSFSSRLKALCNFFPPSGQGLSSENNSKERLRECMLYNSKHFLSSCAARLCPREGRMALRRLC